jgi:uncharacterized membrane protein
VNARLAIPVIWGLAGALLLKLWNAWDQLPERVAVHFGFSLQPNGWSSKGGLAVIIALVAVGQATLATWLILRVTSVSAMMAPIQLAVSVVLVCAFWQVINYNAKGAPFQPLWILAPMVLLFATITALLLQTTFRYYRR